MTRAPLTRLLLAAAVMGVACSCRSPSVEPTGLLLAGADAGTRVAIQMEGEESVVDIHCPKGIGWAEFRVPSGPGLDRSVFRLYLHGLESLVVEQDGLKLMAACSSHGDATVRQWREDGSAPPGSEQLSIRLVSRNGGTPRIPLDGWFELQIPASVPEPGIVRLRWIDFYR